MRVAAVLATVLALAAGLGAATAPLSGKKVLVLLPSESFLRLQHGRLVRVGSYLDEVVVPSMALAAAGAALTFATPQGNKPVVDPRSNASSYFANASEYAAALRFWDAVVAAGPTRQVREWTAEDPAAPWDACGAGTGACAAAAFDAVFVPGGHAPMVDLWPSTAVGRILVQFARAKKPIVAICHGPVVLAAASLLTDVPTWPFRGSNLTVFSQAAEEVVEAKYWGGDKLGYYPPQILAALGAAMVEGPHFESHVVLSVTVHGGPVLTGQNPASAPALGAAFVRLLAGEP